MNTTNNDSRNSSFVVYVSRNRDFLINCRQLTLFFFFRRSLNTKKKCSSIQIYYKRTNKQQIVPITIRIFAIAFFFIN